MAFSQKLKNILDRKGYTQKKLADMAYLEENAVSRFCTGKSLPNSQDLTAISKALKVSVDYLLEISDVQNIEKSDDLTTGHYLKLEEKTIKKIRYMKNKDIFDSLIENDLIKVFLDDIVKHLKKLIIEIDNNIILYYNYYKDTDMTKEEIFTNLAKDVLSNFEPVLSLKLQNKYKKYLTDIIAEQINKPFKEVEKEVDKHKMQYNIYTANDEDRARLTAEYLKKYSENK